MTTEPETKRAKTSDDVDAMETDDKENVAMEVETKGKGGNLSGAVVRRHMREYYARHYPAEMLFEWLAHGNDKKHDKVDKSYPSRREFCFVLNKDDGGEIFSRYECFADAKEFYKAVNDQQPARIEFGMVCNRRPKERMSVDLKPVERELVFDIDMTDYDDVRTCCSKADICGKCWPLMTVALKILDAGLRKDFGFKHLLWVYSGRRGVHCWVSDERARKLTDETRSAVAEYFAAVKGQGRSRSVAKMSPMHPSLKRAYTDVLEKYWVETYLPNQEILTDQAKLDQVLELINDEGIREDLRDEFSSSRNNAKSVERWQVIVDTVKKALQKKQGKNWKLEGNLEQIIFWHIYPRVDIEVSKHMNHLLKGPFCVHPKTGRVCVPIDPAVAEHFDPESVPTVVDLVGPNNNQTLDDAKETFNKAFWKAAEAENMQRLTAKTRAAKEANQSGLDF